MLERFSPLPQIYGSENLGKVDLNAYLIESSYT